VAKQLHMIALEEDGAGACGPRCVEARDAGFVLSFCLMKEPIAHSAELLHRIKEALTPNRLPLLIAIDGADGIGKSSLASWLAWQLGIPTVHLDLFLGRPGSIQWRVEDLKRTVDCRGERPLIVEGALVLDALEQIESKADFVVFVKGETSRSLANQVAKYQARRGLPGSAHFSLEGYIER
jgi:hypothetical protein